MILDSSVVAAICLGEPDAEVFLEQIAAADVLRMSAANYAEAAIVIDARRPGAFDVFVSGLDLEIVDVDREQAEIARSAYRRYGKRSGHDAALNFGDCFAYALACKRAEPLLFKGTDFTHTDVPRLEP